TELPSAGSATSPAGRSLETAAQPGLPPGASNLASRAAVTSSPAGLTPAQAAVDASGGGLRFAGDASGDTVTLAYQAPVTVRGVGFVPGAQGLDPASGSDLWSSRRVISKATMS